MGVQMAAINMQTPGVATFLDHGMFQQNGSTGYVLKPPFMLKRMAVRDKLRRFDALKPNTFCARLMDIHVLTIEVGVAVCIPLYTVSAVCPVQYTRELIFKECAWIQCFSLCDEDVLESPPQMGSLSFVTQCG